MTTSNVKVALIQMNCSQSVSVNLNRALSLVSQAKAQGANIVCLPELFLGLYFCQKKDDSTAFNLAEPIPGPTIEMLSQAAKKNGIVLIGGSIFEKTKDGKYYNTAPVFGPDGELLGCHRKIHIPEDFLYHEQHYFSPGQEPVKVFDTPFGKISVLICFDQWFPEAARSATLQGAEIIFYPTAIGKIDEEVEENITGDWQQMWTNVQLGHAAANGVFVAAVNRVGREGSIQFWGGSFIADPASQIIAKAAEPKDDIVIADCDLTRVKKMQDAWGFLRNRQPKTYEKLTEKVK